MTQKAFTPSLARRLNAACMERRARCSRKCLGIGWCGRCWEWAEPRRDGKKPL